MISDQNRQMHLLFTILEHSGKKLKLLLAISMGFSLLLLISCNKLEVKNQKKYYERALNAPSLPEKIENPAESLNLLCWNDYFPQALFDVFEQIYGTKVHVDYFANNEELRDMYKQNPEKWDLLMPSDYMVRQFIREGHLRPIDRSRLPKMEELNPGLFNLDCDPGLKYFVPVFQSSLGLSFQVQHMNRFPRHWSYLDSHRKNPYIYGRIAFPNQMRVVFAMALMRLGLDPNTTQLEDIQKAENYLVSFIREFGAEIVGDEIINLEVLNKYLLILTWNGTGAYLLTVNSDYRFLIPEDKTILSIDGFVMSENTKKAETCYLFLDYLMTPQIVAFLSEFSFYAPASLMARRYVNSFILNGPSLMMPEDSDRIFLNDVGDAEVFYNEAWGRVKEAKPSESINIIPLRQF